ncbi:FAD-dependent oxidoreductase [Luteolibacter ambystomatis]|uniref:FAD-dependent oxidoreductase n=1 Tax=Luteolibacter ambystomatis TaxID=2824561 RepID=A0A975G7B7_9BACT|nr:FAD-dependent oxidoreductase [Luteolibacter ambystomatis]QUE50105.1 FAD-dependent oxidoreductase [Luteolibacter ambystomatis]
MNDRISRRVFLAGSLTLGACGRTTRAGGDRGWTGGIVGASHQTGHLLRQGMTGPPVQAETADVIVAGGGMSGLIAALRLKQAGRRVKVIELEANVGGNASSSRNATSAYPWGAHYVPVPSEDMTDVCALLAELGLGKPGAWKEETLCHDPSERLWIRGHWQDGLVPSYGISAEERQQIERFFARMETYKSRRGSDNKRAFAIPVDHSSRDPEFTTLDAITMAEWLQREGFTSPELLWHINYGCRDDYGAGISLVSAWAGIHYFASRDSQELFTWPEGNGWIVNRLREQLDGDILTGHLVTRLTPDGRVEAIEASTGKRLAWQADAIVCAAPRFIAKHLVPELATSPAPDYSPWMVANLTLTGPISETWDNVLRDSRALGYVVATHQSLYPAQGPTVITYYQPLDHLPPPAAREEALKTSYESWCESILTDLERPHPDLRDHLTHLDIWLWGHAMSRPLPGVIHGETRARMRETLGKIHFAHSDMSGLSIFEEACHWGHEASRTILSV